MSVTQALDHDQFDGLRLQAAWWRDCIWFWKLDAPIGGSNGSRIAAADAAEISRSIQEAFSASDFAARPTAGSLSLWVPVEGDAGGQAGTAVASIALQEVKVTALGYSALAAVDLLVRRRKSGVPMGASVAYWSTLARYVVDLLVRQRFMPLLERSERGFAARWQPVVCDEVEVSWLDRVVAAMPTVCRAFVSNDAGACDPVRLVETFLEAAGDGLIRKFLQDDEFFIELPERARREPHWELQFLAGLILPDGAVKGDDDQLSITSEQLSAWTAPLLVPTEEAPLRLAFELVEPTLSENDGESESPVGGWRLRLLVRSSETDEPIDITTIWRQDSSGHSVLRSRAARRRDDLRDQLKRASGAFTPLRRALSGDSPRPMELSAQEAHQFLHEGAPALMGAGFDVELPEWARRSDRSIGLFLDLSSPEGSEPSATSAGIGDGGFNSLGLGTLVDFNWRIAVGEERLSAEDFAKLAEQNAPLVRFRNQWISLSAEEARRALEFVRRQEGGRMTLAQALRMAGGAEDSGVDLSVVGLSGSDWLGRLLAETPEMQLSPLPQPVAFKGEMRPYQLRGLAWLEFLDRLGIGACLADDMGLGKTIQLIALLLHERIRADGVGEPAVRPDRAAVGPTLLFAPMSVVGNWEREIERFAPSLRVLVHHGGFRLSGDAFVEKAVNSDVVITTYGLASRELEAFRRVQWHRVAMDEAQKIKNPSAAQTVALRSIPSPRRVALTGTPLENHLVELWSIIDSLNPGLLGSLSQFRVRYASPIERNGDASRAEQLRRFIRPFVLRRLKSDPTVACDLPEKMEMRVYCNLTPEQASLYEQTVAAMLEQVDRATGIRRRGLILSTLTRLKQICNHPAQFLKSPVALDGRSGKCERLVEMLEEVIEEGDAALVFTQYREMGDLLDVMLTKRLEHEILFLHGGTPMKKRNDLIDRFQNENDPSRIFLLSLRAGGFGLNLTRANHVFHFDRWWNPAVEEQATDRAHRIGQTRRVQVHKFICVGTVEERIDRLLAEKSALAENIVGSGDDWLTGLSTVELREYLTLSDDAVAEND